MSNNVTYEEFNLIVDTLLNGIDEKMELTLRPITDGIGIRLSLIDQEITNIKETVNGIIDAIDNIQDYLKCTGSGGVK